MKKEVTKKEVKKLINTSQKKEAKKDAVKDKKMMGNCVLKKAKTDKY
jgi:hypothetical protein